MEPNLEKVQDIRKMTSVLPNKRQKNKRQSRSPGNEVSLIGRAVKKIGKFHTFGEDLEEIAKLLPKNMAIHLDG